MSVHFTKKEVARHILLQKRREGASSLSDIVLISGRPRGEKTLRETPDAHIQVINVDHYEMLETEGDDQKVRRNMDLVQRIRFPGERDDVKGRFAFKDKLKAEFEISTRLLPGMMQAGRLCPVNYVTQLDEDGNLVQLQKRYGDTFFQAYSCLTEKEEKVMRGLMLESTGSEIMPIPLSLTEVNHELRTLRHKDLIGDDLPDPELTERARDRFTGLEFSEKALLESDAYVKRRKEDFRLAANTIQTFIEGAKGVYERSASFREAMCVCEEQHYLSLLERSLDKINPRGRKEKILNAGKSFIVPSITSLETGLIHGDTSTRNMLRNEDGFWVYIDFFESRVAPVITDSLDFYLSCLVSCNIDKDQLQSFRATIEEGTRFQNDGEEAHCAFALNELFRAVKLYGTLSKLVRESCKNADGKFDDQYQACNEWSRMNAYMKGVLESPEKFFGDCYVPAVQRVMGKVIGAFQQEYLFEDMREFKERTC